MSTLGRVHSLSRVVCRSDGVNRKFPGKVLKCNLVSGYAAVSLSRNDIAVKRYVHELVLETFVGPRPEGHQVRHHPNPDRRNNKLSNLRWGTPAQNVGNHLGRYLTDSDVEEVHRLRNKGMLQQDIADRFGCTQGYISTLVNNHRRPVEGVM